MTKTPPRASVVVERSLTPFKQATCLCCQCLSRKLVCAFSHGGVLCVVALAGEPGLRAGELCGAPIGKREEPRDALRDRSYLDRAMVLRRGFHRRSCRRLCGGKFAPDSETSEMFRADSVICDEVMCGELNRWLTTSTLGVRRRIFLSTESPHFGCKLHSVLIG
jgi:hypothetical protein